MDTLSNTKLDNFASSMPIRALRRRMRVGAVSLALTCIAVPELALSDEPAIASAELATSTDTNTEADSVDSSTSPPPLRLQLSTADLRKIVLRHEPTIEQLSATQLEEVTVTAPVELLPMRDLSQDVWGGVAAPFWALSHPTQAWRIFLPIPPR